MEKKNIIDGDIVSFAESALGEHYERIAKTASSVIVATAFDVITRYRAAGMQWQQIADAFTIKGVPVKADSLRKMYMRAEKTRARLPVVVAEISAQAQEWGGGQERLAESLPVHAPVPVQVPTPAPAQDVPLIPVGPKTATTTTAQAPIPRRVDSRPLTPGAASMLARIQEANARVSEEDKKLMHRLLDEVPKPGRDFTAQLNALRFWTAPDGRVLDVLQDAPKDIENDNSLRPKFQMASVMYANARREWLVNAGVCVVGGSGRLLIAYKRAELPPLTIDLAKTVADHLD